METKKSLIQLAILVVFVIMAAGSGSSSSSSTYPSSSSTSGGYSNAPYSRQASEGMCAVCGGLGYITSQSGDRQKCICGGSGKATNFPETKKRY